MGKLDDRAFHQRQQRQRQRQRRIATQLFAGQGQQHIDAVRHLRRGHADALKLVGGVRRHGLLRQQLGRTIDDSERCTQFVAGIAREMLLALDEADNAGHRIVERARQQADFVIRKRLGETPWQLCGRSGGNQPGQARQGRRGMPRNQVAQRQHDRHDHQHRRSQEAQQKRYARTHHQLAGNFSQQVTLGQRTQMIVPSLLARKLAAARSAGHGTPQVGRKGGGAAMHADIVAQRWRADAALQLVRRFLIEHVMKKAVFDGVHEQQGERAETQAGHQGEHPERQDKPGAQAAHLAHAAPSSRKPTPCTVTSIAPPNGLSSFWRSW